MSPRTSYVVQNYILLLSFVKRGCMLRNQKNLIGLGAYFRPSPFIYLDIL